MRSRTNAATGMSPAKALYGYEIPKRGDWDIDAYHRERDFDAARQRDRRRVIRTRQLNFNEKHYPKQPGPTQTFQPGENVMVKEVRQHLGTFYPTWSGPHQVTERVSDEVYFVNRDGYEVKVHVDKLRPAPVGNPILSDSEASSPCSSDDEPSTPRSEDDESDDEADPAPAIQRPASEDPSGRASPEPQPEVIAGPSTSRQAGPTPRTVDPLQGRRVPSASTPERSAQSQEGPSPRAADPSQGRDGSTASPPERSTQSQSRPSPRAADPSQGRDESTASTSVPPAVPPVGPLQGRRGPTTSQPARPVQVQDDTTHVEAQVRQDPQGGEPSSAEPRGPLYLHRPPVKAKRRVRLLVRDRSSMPSSTLTDTDYNPR